MRSLSNRVEALAGQKRREEVYVIMPPELVLDKERTLLNVSTGKFHKIEDLSQVGGKMIDVFR
jgi:hypothetical protein